MQACGCSPRGHRTNPSLLPLPHPPLPPLHRRDPLFVPCTPKGCLELLKRSGVQISGKKAAVVGRSNIVGMPAALLLQRADATVTVIHSRTPDAQRICAEADIIIAACGQAEMVEGDWVKPGAAVIDVGINAVDVSASGRGRAVWLVDRLVVASFPADRRHRSSLTAPRYSNRPYAPSQLLAPGLAHPLPTAALTFTSTACPRFPAGSLGQARLPPGGRCQLCTGQ